MRSSLLALDQHRVRFGVTKRCSRTRLKSLTQFNVGEQLPATVFQHSVDPITTNTRGDGPLSLGAVDPVGEASAVDSSTRDDSCSLCWLIQPLHGGGQHHPLHF